MSSVDERSKVTAVPPPDPRPRLTAGRRRRFRLARTIVVVFLIVGAFVVVAESLSLVRHAKQAQASLEAFKTALKNNDSAGAARHLHDADLSLAVARRRYNSAPLAFMRHIPLLSWPISDAGQLLSAATDVASAGGDALGLYDQVKGHGSKLFHDGTVSIPELRIVTRDANGMVAKMDRAERQLRSVHAAFWEPSIGSARDKALGQVSSLRSQGATAQRFLQLAPRLVGADGPRTYLVAVLNPAELVPAGGAALNMMAIRFTDGHMHILQSGSTYDLTNANSRTHFKPVPGDPWLSDKGTVLAAADMSPDFRTSGRELMRGYTAQFGVKLDGVIALDPVALQHLMQQIPPFVTPGYGQISADNIVQTVLVNSYTMYPDFKQRHLYNNTLMHSLLHRLLTGGGMVGKGKALYAAAQGGHLQIYMKDPSVQQEIESGDLLRTLPPAGTGDMIGVYTANASASKVDYWQQRRIDQQVTLHADGSADVVRTVTIVNAAPPYPAKGVDNGYGYLSRWSHPRLIFYLPGAGRVTGWTVNGRRFRHHLMSERGYSIVTTDPIWIPQGGTVTVVLRYALPAGTARGGQYQLAVAAQPMVQPTSLQVTVTGPGACRPASGWKTAGTVAQWSTTDLQPLESQVVCR